MVVKRKKFNKYKVQIDSDGKRNRTFNGIIFDSLLEMRFYKFVICPQIESGEIIKCELQKSYQLQPSFKYNGKLIRSVEYIADFVITRKDGHIVVIDTKGNPDNISLLKKKLFHFKFPEIDYRWITYSKIDGGWVEYSIVKEARSKRKKEKKNNA
jgi:hypothetical protein